MFDLFGSGMPLAARFFIAFLVVLALIGVTAWLVRRFGANRLGGASARGRQPRLAVVDAANVDGRRRLVLIRRDNIEHLLMIGGPSDVVIEPNIVRVAPVPARNEPSTREPVRAEPTLRAAPPPADTAWPLQPSHEPTVAPVAPPRGFRPGATDEPWLPGEPGARPRPVEPLSGLAAELAAKPAPIGALPAARQEVPPPPPPPEPSLQHDRNLAEMAMQLEAALRRAPESHPPVTDPLAVPPAKVEAPLSPPREFKPHSEPKFDTRPAPKLEPKQEPKPEPAKAEAKSELAAEPPKAFYDNLEEEMANLLGRPPGKS